MKVSSTTNQNDFREMSEEFTDIIDEVRAFKEEVFERCDDYVRHASNLEQRVIDLNKKEEVNIKTVQDLKAEVKESIDHQEQAVAVYASNMENYYDQTSKWMLESYSQEDKIEELSTEITELKTWQTEIEAGHTNIKTEKAIASDNTETEAKGADVPQNKDVNSESAKQQINQVQSFKSVAQTNKQIRYSWYKICIENDWMPEEYKPSYVHPGRLQK